MEDRIMKKKIYIQPNIKVVALQHQSHILSVSNIHATNSSGDDIDLGYDRNGGDQGYAW